MLELLDLLNQENPNLVSDIEQFIQKNPNCDYNDIYIDHYIVSAKMKNNPEYKYVNRRSILSNVLSIVQDRALLDKLLAFILSYNKPDGTPLISIESFKKEVNRIPKEVYLNETVKPKNHHLLLHWIDTENLPFINAAIHTTRFPKEAFNRLSDDPQSPLVLALDKMRLKLLKYPLWAGFKYTVFRDETIDIIRALIGHPNFPKDYLDPLRFSCENNMHSAVELLLNEANPPSEVFLSDSDTPLFSMAIRYSSKDIIISLINYSKFPRECLTKTEREGMNPLMLAIARGDEEIIKLLINQCNLPDDCFTQQNSTGLNALMLTKDINDFEVIVNELKRRKIFGQCCQQVDWHKRNALMLVVESYDRRRINFLLDQEDLNRDCFLQQNDIGCNAFQLALIHNLQTAPKLLTHRNFPSECLTQVNANGDNAFMTALRFGHSELIKSLFDKGNLPFECFNDKNGKNSFQLLHNNVSLSRDFTMSILSHPNAPLALVQSAPEKVILELKSLPLFATYIALKEYAKDGLISSITRNHIPFAKELLAQPHLTLAMIKEKIIQYNNALPADKKMKSDGTLMGILKNIDKALPEKVKGHSQYLDPNAANASKTTSKVAPAQSATSSLSESVAPPQAIPPTYNNFVVSNQNEPHSPSEQSSSTSDRLQRYTTMPSNGQLLAAQYNRGNNDDDNELILPSPPSNDLLNVPSVPANDINISVTPQQPAT